MTVGLNITAVISTTPVNITCTILGGLPGAAGATGATGPAWTPTGNLALFQALTGAADKLPYFSAVDAISLTDITAFVRTLLDDADAATALGTLGAKGDSVSATSRILGRVSAGAGVIEELTAAQVKTLLAIVEADITLADNTTNDSSISKHGFCPKLPNDTAKYLRGDGTWVAPSTTPADASVSQAKLKTSSGEVSTSVTANLTLPGGEYGFYPQTKCTSYVSGANGAMTVLVGTTFTYATYIGVSIEGEATIYAKQRYVTSSGEVFWVFLLRDRETGELVSSYAAPDHPCFGNGGKPALVPHPFPDYDKKKHEIVVINPTAEQLAEIDAACEVEDEDKPDRTRLEVILEDYEPDTKAKVSWPEKAVTVGLPKGYDWQKAAAGTEVVPIKKVISQPDGVKLAGLVKKKEQSGP